MGHAGKFRGDTAGAIPEVPPPGGSEKPPSGEAATGGWALELTLFVSFGGICSSHSALQNQIKNKHLNHISCLETLIMGAKVKPS